MAEPNFHDFRSILKLFYDTWLHNEIWFLRGGGKIEQLRVLNKREVCMGSEEGITPARNEVKRK